MGSTLSSGWAPDDVVDVVYSSATTRVLRHHGAGAVSKTPLGPEAAARLRHELALLEHLGRMPGIAHLVAPGPATAAIELADGGVTLGEVLRERRFEVAELIALACALATTLARIHAAGVIHRDIHPGNILLSQAAPGAHVLIADFDLAVLAGRPVPPHLAAAVGTLGYVAPEQFGRTARVVDHRADLYALGATLYHLGTGRAPFVEADPLLLMHAHLVREPDAPARCDARVPHSLSDIILRLLAKEPEQRYQSAEGLAHDLRRVQASLGTNGGGTFVLGERDFPSRLAAPAHLVGRDAETRALLDAFDDAMDSPRRTVLLDGAKGVGKSALIEQLRPVVQQARGWYVYGKFDQFQKQDTTGGATWHAIRMLGRQLLSLPREQVEALRERILQALGRNAGVLARIVPEFKLLLGDQAEEAAADPHHQEERVMQMVVDLLCTIASRQRPVVVVLDDLQWASDLALRTFERIATDPRIRGLLLVAAWRGDALEEGHALRGLPGRWRGGAGTARMLAVGNLQPGELAVLVGGMLRLAPARAQELGEAIHAMTAGNPFQAVELLNGLRAAGEIQLTPEGWTWDKASVLRFIGKGDVAQLVAARIRQLPTPARAVLECMSCLGGRAATGLLATASAVRGDDLQVALQAAIAQGLVVFDVDAADTVRFTHDTVQEVVLGTLQEGDRSHMQLAMARRLVGRRPHRRHAAQQYLQCCALLVRPRERRAVAMLFLEMASRLMNAANFTLAEKYLRSATRLADAQGPHAHDLCVAIGVGHHRALYTLGLLDEAAALFGELERHLEDPEILAEAACLQMRAFDIVGRQEDGVALGQRLVAQLGLPQSQAYDDTQLHARLRGLADWIRDERTRGIDRLTPVTDRRLLAASRLLSQLVRSGYRDQGGPEFIWFLLHCQQLWVRHGPCAAIASVLCRLSVPVISILQDYRLGFEVAQHVLAVSEARGWEPETSEARHVYSGYACHWFLPLEESRRQTHRACEGVLARGDISYACYIDLCRLWIELTAAQTLAAFDAAAGPALARSRRTGNFLTEALLEIAVSVARTLRAEPGADDWPRQEEAIRARLGAMMWVDRTIEAARAHAALLMGDFDALQVRAGASLFRDITQPGFNMRATPGHVWTPNECVMVVVLLSWRLRHARSPDAAADGEQLEACRAWIARRAADNPGNFHHLHKFVEAQHAWAQGDRWKAAGDFDAAIRAAAQVCRPWHRGLIAEHAALFHLEHDMAHLGAHLMREAHAVYAAWGAVAKVRQLEAVHPWLRAAAPTTLLAHSPTSSGTTAETLDLMAVLSASRVLSSETSLGRLAARLTEVIAAVTGATDVALLTQAERGWVLLDAQQDGEVLQLVAVEDAARAGRVPGSVFRYAERTAQTLRVDDAAADERFARDPYFAALAHCSLMVLPIRGQGETRAMVLATNRVGRAAFGAERVDAAMLIAGQLAVSLANAQLYASLEERVRSRTEELQKMQAALVTTARRAGMAEIASNVLHNVGNVLNSTTVAATMLGQQLRQLKVDSLDRVVSMLDENAADLAGFLQHDARGKLLPRYLGDVATALQQQQRAALEEVETVLRSVTHMHAIVRSQQTYAGASSFIEEVDAAQVVEDALGVDAAATPLDGLEVLRQFETLPPLALDRQRILLILVNLIGNAREAMHAVAADARKLTLGLSVDRSNDREFLCLSVRDQGCGIAPEHIPKLFSHGFTTKQHGHGFGLHSCALAAMEMGGTLEVRSDGPGCGAMFTLKLPLGAQVGIEAPL